MSLEQQVERIARDHQVDLVGFARVEDVELAHPARPAADLLPGARTVIAFAAALLKGALDCPRGTKGAVKDALVAYDRMEHAGAAVGRFLESRGHLSYVPPASMPVDVVRHRGRGMYAAEWSHRQAAIACGLGVQGRNNLLVTPEYGPRVRLASLLTTAELPPTRRTLPEDLCNDCGKCVRACPVNALAADPDAVPRLDQIACRRNYLRPFLGPSVWQTVKQAVSYTGFALLGVQTLLEGYYFSCAECQRVCPRGRLESPGRAAG